MKPVTIVPVLLLALALLSCGQGPAVPAEAQPLVDLAKADLARLVPDMDIEVVRVEAVQWRDGCLECGGPAESCLAVIVPGYRIVLRAAGQEYEYRTDRIHTVRLCPTSAGPVGWAEAQPQVATLR